jgi:hypothetical protein
MIIRTVGMIAGKNPTGVLQFIKVMLSMLEPLLPEMNDEKLKLASTFSET